MKSGRWFMIFKPFLGDLIRIDKDLLRDKIQR